MIKNIVFDAGGVIVEWDPYKVLERFVPERSKWPELYKNVFESDEWLLMDAGFCSPGEAAELMAANAKGLEAEARALALGWPECLPRIDGTAELMRELKSRGYGVYVLSNWCNNFYEIPTLHPALDIADGALVSSEEKLAKPDVRIYERFYEKFSLEAASCLFTDDRLVNIEGARRAGMSAELFTTPAEFRLKLAELGVL